jgi:hypothetical protein
MGSVHILDLKKLCGYITTNKTYRDIASVMIVITLLIIALVFITVNGHMLPINNSHVCEKYRNSEYAQTPDWMYRLDGDGSYVPSNMTPGLLFVNETVCLDECDSNDKCVSIAFRKDGRCIQIAQCYLTDRVTGYSYYSKQSFNNDDNYTLDFGKECKQTAVQINTGVVPSTVPECWGLCVNQRGCNYAEINDMMECVLHDECEYLYYHPDPDLRRGIIISNGPGGSTTGGSGGPTQSPTSLLTEIPSTYTPTGEPTNNGGDPPTDPPTFPTHTHDGGHDDDGLTLGHKIGIGLGVTLVVLIIMIGLVWFFKLK